MIVTEHHEDQFLARLAASAKRVRLAEEAAQDARTSRDTLIVEGIANGYNRTAIAVAVGLTTTRITHIVAA